MSEVERRSDGYWITGLQETEDCGPYDTKIDAEGDRRGMERFFKYEKREGFITIERIESEGKQF